MKYQLCFGFTSTFIFAIQTLQIEFTQQENLLQDLEADVIVFREQKKLEAAERLEQQIALLKVNSALIDSLHHCTLLLLSFRMLFEKKFVCL